MNSKHNQSGFIAVILVIAVVVIAVAGVGYYLITSNKSTVPLIPSYMPGTADQTIPGASPSASVAPVSSSTDMNVIDGEIKATNVNSVDSDFKSMSDSASSL